MASIMSFPRCQAGECSFLQDNFELFSAKRLSEIMYLSLDLYRLAREEIEGSGREG
jgi:hypothetical protein